MLKRSDCLRWDALGSPAKQILLIDDRQRGPGGSRRAIGRVPANVVVACVVVVIEREVDAELRLARLVDERATGGADRTSGNGAVTCGIAQCGHLRRISSCLKVTRLERHRTAEARATLDVHIAGAMGCEGIGAGSRTTGEVERGRNDRGTIREGRCVERQDGLELTITVVVACTQRRRARAAGVNRTTGARGFARFKDATVLSRDCREGDRRAT